MTLHELIQQERQTKIWGQGCELNYIADSVFTDLPSIKDHITGLYKKECDVCHSEFYSKVMNKKYCCAECAAIAKHYGRKQV